MTFLPLTRWNQQATGWGTDFDAASIGASEGIPRANIRLWGRAGVLGVKDLTSKVPVQETADGWQFSPGLDRTLKLEHVKGVDFPNGEQYNPSHGLFKATLTLPSVPVTPAFVYTLGWVGVKYAYQPALTAWELAEGCTRPDWCVGSYVIFEKGTGLRLGHITRPFAIDDNGDWTWGALSIINDECTVAFDPAWLAAAAYPVVIDPNMGYDSEPASAATGTSDYIWLQPGGGSDGGTMDSVKLWCFRNPATSVTVGLYTTDGTLFADSAGGDCSTSKALLSQSVSGTLVAGACYWPAFNCDDNITMYYDTDTNAASPMLYDASVYSAGTLPNPIPSALTNASLDRRYGLYAAYTAPAGGGMAARSVLINGYGGR